VADRFIFFYLQTNGSKSFHFNRTIFCNSRKIISPKIKSSRNHLNVMEKPIPVRHVLSLVMRDIKRVYDVRNLLSKAMILVLYEKSVLFFVNLIFFPFTTIKVVLFVFIMTAPLDYPYDHYANSILSQNKIHIEKWSDSIQGFHGPIRNVPTIRRMISR
jgi:hypothetical protein